MPGQAGQPPNAHPDATKILPFSEGWTVSGCIWAITAECAGKSIDASLDRSPAAKKSTIRAEAHEAEVTFSISKKLPLVLGR
jgi:hypothetical protein